MVESNGRFRKVTRYQLLMRKVYLCSPRFILGYNHLKAKMSHGQNCMFSVFILVDALDDRFYHIMASDSSLHFVS